MLSATLMPTAMAATSLWRLARKCRMAERTAVTVLRVLLAAFWIASCTWRVRVCICAWVVTLRTVSFAAVRSWRCPWVTPRISRGAVLAVTAFSFARCRGKSAPRCGRCAASGSVPHSACFGLTPRSPAAWARVVSTCYAARLSRLFSICSRANLRPCCMVKTVFFLTMA